MEIHSRRYVMLFSNVKRTKRHHTPSPLHPSPTNINTTFLEDNKKKKNNIIRGFRTIITYSPEHRGAGLKLYARPLYAGLERFGANSAHKHSST